MKSLLALLLISGFAAVTFADTCPDTCSRQVCKGWWWNRSCRTVSYSCTKYCVHGGWSTFRKIHVEPCSTTCGNGTHMVTYKRSCTNPPPQYGGKDCLGSDTRKTSETCNLRPCPIDGGWSKFNRIHDGSCSTTCGNGTLMVTYERNCTNPAPQYGGRDCNGSDTEILPETCNLRPCPIDGGWTEFTPWQDYDECNVLCGNGTKDQWRSRTCTNPTPAYGGEDCRGPHIENRTITCNPQLCEDCPDDKPAYIEHPTNSSRYYQCDNGVARLRHCGQNTRWLQQSKTCDHAEDQQALARNPSNECDPNHYTMSAADQCRKFTVCAGGKVVSMPCAPPLLFNGIYCDFPERVTCPLH